MYNLDIHRRSNGEHHTPELVSDLFEAIASGGDDIAVIPPFGIRPREPKYGLRDEGLINFSDSLDVLNEGSVATVVTTQK